jgi:hypothetical protein
VGSLPGSSSGAMAMVPHRSRKGARKGGRGDPALGPDTFGGVERIPTSVQTRTMLWHARVVDSLNIVAGAVFFKLAAGNVISPANTWLVTAAQYTSMAAVWDEYRIVRIRVRGIPINRYSGLNDDAALLGYDADGVIGSSVSSVAQAWTYPSTRAINLADPFELVWEVPQGAARIWYDIAAIGSSTAQPGEMFVTGGTTPWGGVLPAGPQDAMRLCIELETLLRGPRI